MSANAVRAGELRSLDIKLREAVYHTRNPGDAAQVEEIRTLLSRKAEPGNIPVRDGWGLVDFAVDHHEVVQLLLDAKAEPTNKSIRLAIKVDGRVHGRDATMKSLIEARAPIAEAKGSFVERESFIKTAIGRCHPLDTIKLLVTAGAYVPSPRELDVLGCRIEPEIRNFLNAQFHPEAVQAAAAAAPVVQLQIVQPESAPEVPAPLAGEAIVIAIPAPAQQPFQVEEEQQQAASQAAARPEPPLVLPAPPLRIEPAQNDPLPPMQGPQQLPQAARPARERQAHYCSCFVGILPEFILNGIDAVYRFFVRMGRGRIARGIEDFLNWVFVH